MQSTLTKRSPPGELPPARPPTVRDDQEGLHCWLLWRWLYWDTQTNQVKSEQSDMNRFFVFSSAILVSFFSISSIKMEAMVVLSGHKRGQKIKKTLTLTEGSTKKHGAGSTADWVQPSASPREHAWSCYDWASEQATQCSLLCKHSLINTGLVMNSLLPLHRGMALNAQYRRPQGHGTRRRGVLCSGSVCHAGMTGFLIKPLRSCGFVSEAAGRCGCLLNDHTWLLSNFSHYQAWKRLENDFK